jgi:hypothetical protein
MSALPFLVKGPLPLGRLSSFFALAILAGYTAVHAGQAPGGVAFDYLGQAPPGA